MTNDEFLILKNLSLDLKIRKTMKRIEEWIDYWGEDNVYVSFSGGKDSTVLLDLVRKVNPNIKAVFIDTGLEYPELKDHVKSFKNVEIIKPTLSFKQVIEKWGYPVVSKEQSNYIYRIRNTKSQNEINRYLYGINPDGSKCKFHISKCNEYLLKAPFKISDKCCNEMKKKPIAKYEKETGRKPFVGILAEESINRKRAYLKEGCNAFNQKKPQSRPLGFWTEQDILNYIKLNELKIPTIYGEIKRDNENNRLILTGVERTGCMFCMYGVKNEGDNNRFVKMKKTHPKIYDYCINKLGLKDALDYMKIKY